MKLISFLLLPTVAFAQIAATAQTPAPAKPHAATAPNAATHGTASASKPPGCVPLPQLSPKIPALPASTPCAKSLYTLRAEPAIKIDYVSPLEGTALRDTLGLDSTTFTLAYIDTKIGTGELATPNKWYTIQYTGYLVDGTKFDSSLDHPDHEPFTFQYGQHQVVAGWDTGFAGMHVGGKRRLFIPHELGYGPSAHGPIPPKSMLIFDVELIAQSDSKPAPKTPAAQPAPPTSSTPPAQSAPPEQSAPPAATAPAAAPATNPAKPQ
jgi:peptidylprolyl isomerase